MRPTQEIRDRRGILTHRVFEMGGETFKVPAEARDLQEWFAQVCTGISQATARGDRQVLHALVAEASRLRRALAN